MPIPETPFPFAPLGEALRIATQVHAFQVDKSGDPILFHVMRVAMAMETNEEKIVALLHDAVEDTPGQMMSGESYLPTQKIRLLQYIESAYGEAVAQAVYALTRIEGEPYPDYIRRVAKNPLATKVKIADCIDNSNPQRLAKLPVYEYARLEAKYGRALHILRQSQMDRFNKGETQ